jgi:plasmid replication initiation protein
MVNFMSDLMQVDLFQVTAHEPPLRDNRDAMEYPFLALQKGRKKAIDYTSKDGRVAVKVTAPEEYGIATIWDWDLIIYLSAHINDALENGQEPSPWIEFAPYDALKYMGKSTGGNDYKQLVKTLRRLFATTIITSVRTSDSKGMEEPFRWVEGYKLPKKHREHEWMRNLDDGEPDASRPWRVKLPDWIYQAILRRTGILAVHRDYFKLTGGLERWLYRLARKACPEKANSPLIPFKMETLHHRSGSTRSLRFFAADIRKIVEKQGLPEYSLVIHKKGRNELVYFMHDKTKPRRLPRGLSS